MNVASNPNNVSSSSTESTTGPPLVPHSSIHSTLIPKLTKYLSRVPPLPPAFPTSQLHLIHILQQHVLPMLKDHEPKEVRNQKQIDTTLSAKVGVVRCGQI